MGNPLEAVSRQPERSSIREGNEGTGVNFPWEEAAVDSYKEFSKSNPERLPYVEGAIKTFFEQELKNLDLYKSKEKQAAFPYTVIRVKEFAKALFNTYGQSENLSPRVPESGNDSEATDGPRIHKEFFFTTVLETHNGHGFTMVERAMHEAMQALPAALTALREGREPDDIEFYTLGFPTNELGHMSPSFADEMVKQPFESLGQLYAEFVKHELSEDASGPQTQVTFSGISMGCNFAAEAARTLVDEGILTQSSGATGDKKQAPHLTINAYSPTGTNESSLSYAQIGAGFIADTIAVLATNTSAREIAFAEKSFFNDLKTYLAQRKDGPKMATYMDAEQTKLKGKVVGTTGSIVQTLLRRVPFDPRLKINKITGLMDPTLFSLSRSFEAKSQKGKPVTTQGGKEARSGQTLGAQTLGRREPQHREFGVRSSHNIPFFGLRTDSEMRRWDKVAQTLQRLEADKARAS